MARVATLLYCRHRKGQKNETNATNINDDNIVAIVSEDMAVNGKVPDWWYDTCATVHVSYDKALFKTYFDITDGQEIQMVIEGRYKVVRKRIVELNFTSGKKITLVNVLHVPEMNRNLVSGDLLGKPGVKSIFESKKLVLSSNGVFFWKRLF